MSGLWRRAADFFFFLLLVMAYATPSWACYCYDIGPRPCQLLKEPEAVFVGKVVAIENPPPAPETRDDAKGVTRYRLTVDENFKSVNSAEIDVYSGRGGGDCSYHFKLNERYLVYATVGKDGSLHVSSCSSTRPLDTASSLVLQLRAARDRQPVASLFGTVRREQLNYPSAVVPGYDGPVQNTEVRLVSSEGKLVITHTDEQGNYAFYNLAPGTYAFDADLPKGTGSREDKLIGVSIDPPEAGLFEAGASLRDYLKPVKVTGGYPNVMQLPAAACEEHNEQALPLGKIRVRVVRPDGTPVSSDDPGTSVALFTADHYVRSGGRYGDVAAGLAEFGNLAPGDYIIVFNDNEVIDLNLLRQDNNAESNESFHRTFYPDVKDPEHAVRIHISEQNQLANVEMTVRDPIVRRRLTIRLAWQGTPPENAPLFVLAQSDTIQYTVVQREEPGVFVANIRTDAHYWFHGESSCGPFRPVETEAVMVDGADGAVHEVNLLLSRQLCTAR